MKTKTGYKRTGVLIVDKVCACIDFYANTTPVSEITLDYGHWLLFRAYAEKQAKGCVNEDESVELDGVIIRRGSRLQTKDMYWSFKKKGEA